MKYWIIERPLGRAYTTFTRCGEVVRVPLGGTRIGPFSSVTDAADYLSRDGIPMHASYEIESERAP